MISAKPIVRRGICINEYQKTIPFKILSKIDFFICEISIIRRKYSILSVFRYFLDTTTYFTIFITIYLLILPNKNIRISTPFFSNLI